MVNTMLEDRLKEVCRHTGVQWHVLERDYLLAWILAGITQVPLLLDTLVFKGETALRKCYFGDYRFSEDLDFTGLSGAPRGEEMKRAIQEACDIARRLLEKFAVEVEIVCERYVEKRPHPGEQEAFRIRVRLPWHKYPLTSAKVEVTMDQEILKPVKKRKVIHPYGEPLEAEIKTYSLEEIVAEKLRAILQNAATLRKREWIRPRARDYYDIQRILSEYENSMDFTDFTSFLRKKCAAQNVAFAGPEDFFDDRLLALVEETWVKSLKDLVADLPSFRSVVGELRVRVQALFA